MSRDPWRRTWPVAVGGVVTVVATVAAVWIGRTLMDALGLAPEGHASVSHGSDSMRAHCNPWISGLVVLLGVIAGSAGLGEWRARADASAGGARRSRRRPWPLLLAAAACFLAAVLLYVGSCLFPEGSS